MFTPLRKQPGPKWETVQDSVFWKVVERKHGFMKEEKYVTQVDFDSGETREVRAADVFHPISPHGPFTRVQRDYSQGPA